ncbi:DUF4395 domain-containing protein [Rhabdothermincola salaria]|uniref:DUF4395 domain-containing protein n=1 Tax=Rhabdothermincola salaria TaxID=2903142 RepID=UPI001E5FBD3E|nr:DUF4395 domain-containing protein [Rhabdothermincola salaria]MCD9624179.1 DUF4395 domain-containing protein [Rhabdothermincola salaria]
MTQSERPRFRPADLFGFPDPVNEVSARLVAAGVVAMVVTTVLTGWRWLPFVIAYGFVARVLTGPTASPLGQLVTRVITPRLPIAPRLVPGPPKRFAQGIGVAFSLTAVALTLAGAWTAAQVVLGLLAAAAFLEAALGLCLGCKAFAVLMRLGIVPDSVCERCNDLWGTDDPATSPA